MKRPDKRKWLLFVGQHLISLSLYTVQLFMIMGGHREHFALYVGCGSYWYGPPNMGCEWRCSKASSNYEAKKQKSSTSFMVSFFHTSCSTFFVKASKSCLFHYIWTSHHIATLLSWSTATAFLSEKKPLSSSLEEFWMNDWHRIQFWLPQTFQKVQFHFQFYR
jgi:hypothetical protein